MKVIVTGGAGFIGSCIVRTLNDMGISDIIVVDNIASTDKWKNMLGKSIGNYIHKSRFIEKINSGEITGISHIIHMGACSATTELDYDYLHNNNFEYSKALWNYSIKNDCSFIYASSAATYGDGKQGFNDNHELLQLKPLNGYGYSKHIFDIWTEGQNVKPKQYVGLKFFNVYGPNEYFKGSMASVVYHSFKQVEMDGKIRLFKSCDSQYPDGGQLRDFVYVKDICKIIKFLIETPTVSGLFNCGTGIARSFEDLAVSVFKALGEKPNIEYIDMPEHLKRKYQYYTKADMKKFRDIGYNERFYTLEEGVADYVCNYLDKDYLVF